MDVELLTVFNALIDLRNNLDDKPHLLESEIEFLAFATKMAPYSNAQLLQDLWVLYELKEKRNGYFVEFGACDGISLSNTLLLEKTFGWQGALAEPARAWHAALYRNRNCYITDQCVYKTDGIEVLFNEVDIGELSGVEDLIVVEGIMRKDPKVIEQCGIVGIPPEDMHKVYCDPWTIGTYFTCRCKSTVWTNECNRI